ncbi:RsiV family protein [Micromonospora sp. NPDC049089]|uniref:RsiV family protein n=1 Tax=Micromonospora sp. NPDC049089 TaxID=3155496 RepID=UPI0033C59999
MVPLPPYGDGFSSGGEYVQVAGLADGRRVNDALRQLVLEDMALAQQSAPPKALRPDEYPGEYVIRGAAADLAATSSFVSVMIPASFGLPNGNPQAYWLALTVRVPSGEPVRFTDLLADPTAAFTTLAQVVKRRLRADPCVGEDFDRLPPHAEWDTAEPYRDFALIDGALVLGYGKYQVGAGACGSVRVVIPWSEVSQLMTKETLGWMASLPQNTQSPSR